MQNPKTHIQTNCIVIESMNNELHEQALFMSPTSFVPYLGALLVADNKEQSSALQPSLPGEH